MKKQIVKSLAGLGVVVLALAARADTSRSLGEFSLHVSPAPWEPEINRLDIGAPAADLVYADFSYQPSSDISLNFGFGSGSSYHCDDAHLKYSFTVSELDLSGRVVSSTHYPNFPRDVRFKGATTYVVRSSVSNFPTPCEFLNKSFLVFPSN